MISSNRRWFDRLVLAVALFPSSAVAQTGWEKVEALRPGTEIIVTLTTGERRDYVWVRSRADALTFSTPAGEETVPKSLVKRVTSRAKFEDSPWNGTANGALIGMGTSVGIAVGSHGPVSLALMAGTAIGMFAGYAADKSRNGTELLYPLTPPAVPQVAQVPAAGTSRFHVGSGLAWHMFRSDNIDDTVLAPTLTFAGLLTDHLSFQFEVAKPTADFTTVRTLSWTFGPAAGAETVTAEHQFTRQVKYSVSALFGLHAQPTERVGVEVLAGLTFEPNHEAVSGPFRHIVQTHSEVGSDGPGAYYVRRDWVVDATLTLGLNVPVRIGRRVEVVPQLRFDFPSQFRPAIGVRWGL